MWSFHKEENDHAGQRSPADHIQASALEQGKLIEPSRATAKHVWSIRTKLRSQTVSATWRCSIWQSQQAARLRCRRPQGEDIARTLASSVRRCARRRPAAGTVRVTEQPQAVDDIRADDRKPGDFLFAAPRRPGRGLSTGNITPRRRLIRGIGLDPACSAPFVARPRPR